MAHAKKIKERNIFIIKTHTEYIAFTYGSYRLVKKLKYINSNKIEPFKHAEHSKN